MKVLLISHTCQTRAEGQRKAEQLARLGGIELLVLTPERFNHYGVWKEAEPPEHTGFELAVRKVRWPWLGPAQNYLHWYPELKQVLRDFQPDVIDLWEEPWALVSAHTCWLRNRLLPQTRIVMESEQNLNKQFPPPFRWIESYVIRNADRAVGRSSEVIEVLRAKGYKGPANVVGNAADTELFRPLDRTACRRELSWDKFTIGYVGRLVERKGLMDMVEALAFLPGDLQMAFVGSGEYRPELERRIAELGKAGQVCFIDARPLEELPQVMNALDALILPSRTVPSWKEQFGRVIIEAHACSTPVIGSDSGAIPEVVGQGGLIFPEGNAEALAGAILRLKENPGLGREWGEHGRQQVEAKYTWAKVAAQMRDIYTTFNRRASAVPQPALANA
jgi:glycosyltransferase involved in cell wall biosynthesis